MAKHTKVLTQDAKDAKAAYMRAHRAKAKATREASQANNEVALAILPDQIVHSEDYSRAEILDAVAALPEDAPFIEPVPAHYADEDLPDLNSPEATLAAEVAGEDRGPGLARLRAHPKAEEIRQSTLDDAVKALNSARGERGINAQIAKEESMTDVQTAPSRKPSGSRAAALASAEAGNIPEPPDFSANTHKPYRKLLEAVVELVEAGDIAGLEAYQIGGFIGSSKKAILKYRGLALTALKANRA